MLYFIFLTAYVESIIPSMQLKKLKMREKMPEKYH